MKKFLIRSAAVLGLTIVGVFLFRGQIIRALEGPITRNMFVAEDSDAYDPGLPIGAQFPPIRALYQGQEITNIDQFIGDRGAIFVTTRSADW